MVDYMVAVKRPFTNLRKFSIGSILYMIPYVNMITQFFANGYVLRAAKLSAEGERVLPDWDSLGNLFIDGFLMLIIGLIYLLPVGIIAYILEGPPLFLAFAGVQDIFLFDVGTIIVLLLGLFVMYIIPLVLVHFAVVGKFKAAFDFKTIFRKTLHKEYLLTWLIAIIYSGLVGAIAGVLSALLNPTVIGPYILGGLVSFTLAVTVFTLFGEVYLEVR